MAIERGEVERLLGWASIGEIAIQPYGHVARMADSEVIAELCRTWLAVQDAPVGDVYRHPHLGPFAEAPDELVGQQVRLVPAGGEG